MIHAPFNFVPLSDKVFLPDWADKISHDLPFREGMDGVLRLTITAKTPVYVRNGHTRQDAEDKNDVYTAFSQVDGRPFIPASTIKGAVRNVLEILSFGKMSHIDDKRYSTRDLKSTKEYMPNFQVGKVRCGWMTKTDPNHVQIIDCGTPYFISIKEIDRALNTSLHDFCTNGDNFKSENKNNRLAKTKYQKVGTVSLNQRFKELPPSENKVDVRPRLAFDANGDVTGTIVFTGQPGLRKDKTEKDKGSGKGNEFVFPDPKANSRSFSLDMYEEKGLFEDFCFIYKDSDDWQFWKSKMEMGGRVPVFFVLDEYNKLKHFGLSYMYRLPAAGRMMDYLPQVHREKAPDLAECIFGYSHGKEALRGRVQFTHAFYEEGSAVQREVVQWPYMGGPKPTYYPMYLKQNGEGGYMTKGDRFVPYKTLLSSDAQLRGWKRYPVRHLQEIPDSPEGQEDNTNPFIPMAEGSIFHCKVVYHNLLPEELGALLYALMLRKDCYHSLGFAKPFGYGAVEISVDGMSFESEQFLNFKQRFESIIEQQVPDYKKSVQLDEFFKMSRFQSLKPYFPLEYMELKDFVNCKQNNEKKFKEKGDPEEAGQYLVNYSEMIDTKKMEKKAPAVSTEKVKAKITLWGKDKMAQLCEGKDSDKKLPLTGVTNDNSKGVKILDMVWVNIVRKDNGKIKELKLIEKA